MKNILLGTESAKGTSKAAFSLPVFTLGRFTMKIQFKGTIAAALILAASPAFAGFIQSDSLTVFAPNGDVFAQVTAVEGAETCGGVACTYSLPGVAVDPNVLPTIVFEGTVIDQNAISDVFGIFNQGPNAGSLGFMSDTEGSLSVADILSNYQNVFLPAFENNDTVFSFDATAYLDVALRNQGYTATFKSQDVTVPEPASLALLGVGLASFGWSRRKRV